MAEEKQSGSNFIVLAAAVVSAAYFVWQKPHLEGFRPVETLQQAHDDRGKQDVEARLWQDPLAAVQEQYERQKRENPTGEDHSIAKARNDLANSLVIGVMLPGGPYPEDSEARRRERYAVVAALHTAKYDPKDENHLGYFETTQYEPRDTVLQTWEASADLELKLEVKRDVHKEKLLLPAFIPFEQFKSQDEKSNAPEVSILWLNEDVLDTAQPNQPPRPIESIRELLCQVGFLRYGFKIIGPQYSETLIHMLTDTEEQPKFECPQKFDLLSMYNFGATADEHILLLHSGFTNDDKLEDVLRKRNIDYYRTIATDRDLAPVLVEELKRRGIDLKSPAITPDHIVLISESDSFYGRSLSRTVKEELLQYISQKRVESFTYFRGLDGQLPGTKLSAKTNKGEESSETAKSQQPTNTEKAADSQNEVAEGQGQFDYLRRLADHIHRIDNDIRHLGPGKIAAVGILGSDVYDKQLLIEAIKPELPEAVFFTTDLDALLLPHGKFRSTRNLIVASSYGLELASGLQCDIPPFRNGYQSSIFLATRLAINNAPDAEGTFRLAQESGTALDRWVLEPSSEKKSDKLASDIKQAVASPKLFQIGRSQVQTLPTTESSTSNSREYDGNSCDITNRDLLNDLSIDPTEARLFPEIKSGSRIPTGLLIAIVTLVVVLISSKRLRELCFPGGNTAEAGNAPVRPNPRPLILLLVIVLLLGLGISASWHRSASFLTEYGLGEPMSLFEGTSVWPTIALRGMSIILGGWLVFYTLERLKKDLDLRLNEMDLPEPCFRRWSGLSLVDRWYEMASLLWFRPDTEQHGDHGFKTSNGDQTVTDRANNSNIVIRDVLCNSEFGILCMSYCYYSQKSWRLARATIATFMMVAVWFILKQIFGEPNDPARGSVAQQIYTWVTLLDIFVTFLVIFLIVDATLFSRSVVKRLTAVESYWPKGFHLDQGILQDWLDIKFIANRTRCITQLIYFPFIMLALLIVSRSPIFAAYAFTATLVIGQVIILTIIIGSVASLRHAAEQARKTALEHMSEKSMVNRDKPEIVSQLESLSTQVRDMQDGAFAPPLSQPIVKAVLLPLVTYGGTWLVQIYAMPGL